jgi:TATA-box binding protein (TBP) (component of TFIID and TFIIIB)
MDAYQKLKSLGNFSVLPKELKISTMTFTCAFDTEFNLENISRYVKLKHNGIRSVKYGDDENCNRSIIVLKRSKRKKKKKKNKCFYNQVTIIIKPENNNDINIKIFNNGSVQMTGCKSIDDVIEVLHTLCNEMHEIRGLVDVTQSKILPKPFVTQLENMEVTKAKDLNIRMINSNFHIGFEIDRDALYNILTESGYETRYEPTVHACVVIKYNYRDRKKVSVFVFASGSVIITGANSCNQIKESYDFIHAKLYENYKDIRDSNFKKGDIMKFLNA